MSVPHHYRSHSSHLQAVINESYGDDLTESERSTPLQIVSSSSPKGQQKTVALKETISYLCSLSQGQHFQRSTENSCTEGNHLLSEQSFPRAALISYLCSLSQGQHSSLICAVFHKGSTHLLSVQSFTRAAIISYLCSLSHGQHSSLICAVFPTGSTHLLSVQSFPRAALFFSFFQAVVLDSQPHPHFIINQCSK